MTLDSYFPLFGGFVNKNCVLGECWALSYFLTGPGLSFIFPFFHLTMAIPFLHWHRGSSLHQSSPRGQAAAGAQPVLLPAVAAVPHLCTTSPKSRSAAEPQKTQKYWKLCVVGTLQGGGPLGNGERLAESRAGWWGQECCLYKKCLWKKQV